MATTATSAAEAARHAMVASQLRTNAVTDARLIAAMAEVPREAFVGAGNVAVAYRDTPLALEGGRRQNAPLATARLLNAAEIAPGDRVLLIAAAGGYTAAVLARLASEVVAVESDAALADAARAALADIPNVTLIEAPLAEGAPDQAPYDVVVIDGAVEDVPTALADQLRVGGWLVAGLVDRGVPRLASGVRSGGGAKLTPFADIDCVVLPGFAKPRTFQFPQ